MDRRQILGAAAAALGGVWIGLPAWAAELDAKGKKWVILSDPATIKGRTQLCYGGFLFSTNGKVKPAKNRILGASGKIKRGTFTGTLLKQVPPLTHRADAIPVILYKNLNGEAQEATTALNATIDVIAALLSPRRDALDQIASAINRLDDLVVTIQNSKNIADESKPFAVDGVQDGRTFLLQADAMIRELKDPTPQELLTVALKVLEAVQAVQEACRYILPDPPPAE